LEALYKGCWKGELHQLRLLFVVVLREGDVGSHRAEALRNVVGDALLVEALPFLFVKDLTRDLPF
jgi:hypothetical protein